MLDGSIIWKDHIHTREKKITKNLGLLYRAKQLLNEESLKIIYFSYIHSYLNYDNIAWVSTYYTKLKTIHYQQKHAARIIFNEHILSHSRPLTIAQCFKCLSNKFIPTYQFYVQI